MEKEQGMDDELSQNNENQKPSPKNGKPRSCESLSLRDKDIPKGQ